MHGNGYLVVPWLLVWALAGCGSSEEEELLMAPGELDELIHLFFGSVDQGDAGLVVAAGDNLVSWFETDDAVTDGLATGQVSDLTDEEIAELEHLLWEPDPEDAIGVYTLQVVGCSLEQMVDVYIEPDQMALFPDTYVGYDRTFDSDPACFDDGSCDQLDYHSTNTTTLALDIPMTYEMYTRLKRYRGGPASGVGDEVLLARNVMPEPAVEDVDDAGYEQSYHIEAHVPWGGGRTLHLYALWNHGYIENTDPDAPFWPEQYVTGLLDLDEDLGELCANGW